MIDLERVHGKIHMHCPTDDGKWRAQEVNGKWYIWWDWTWGGIRIVMCGVNPEAM